jgi:hypothetical protein
LDAIASLPLSDRYARIMSSTLGQIGLEKGGPINFCIASLRDRAKVSDTCREKLIEFILREGF